MTQCANPACATPLRHLGNGRLYQFEVKSFLVPAETSATDRKKLSRKVWRFWLCGQCSGNLTLEFNQTNGLQVAPLPQTCSSLLAS
jgi:hypothetical protein